MASMKFVLVLSLVLPQVVVTQHPTNEMLNVGNMYSNQKKLLEKQACVDVADFCGYTCHGVLPEGKPEPVCLVELGNFIPYYCDPPSGYSLRSKIRELCPVECGVCEAPSPTPKPAPSPTPEPACADIPGWKDLTGDGCSWYASYSYRCSQYGSQDEAEGHTANTACCVCGGGVHEATTTSPTPEPATTASPSPEPATTTSPTPEPATTASPTPEPACVWVKDPRGNGKLCENYKVLQTSGVTSLKQCEQLVERDTTCADVMLKRSSINHCVCGTDSCENPSDNWNDYELYRCQGDDDPACSPSVPTGFCQDPTKGCINGECKACDWSKYTNKYSSGCLDGCTHYSSVDAAKSACLRNSECEAVTCQRDGSCQTRAGKPLLYSGSETTYVPGASCQQASAPAMGLPRIGAR